MIRAALSLIMAGLLVACDVGGTPRILRGAEIGGSRLSAEEVRSTLIGRPWRGNVGVYFFQESGTYNYRTGTGMVLGPWRYTLDEDGTIRGGGTEFTFFRIGPSIRYRNTTSDGYFLVTLLDFDALNGRPKAPRGITVIEGDDGS